MYTTLTVKANCGAVFLIKKNNIKINLKTEDLASNKV